MELFATKLVALRKQKGYSQREVANHLNVTMVTIHNYEKAKSLPSLGLAVEIAALFEITVNDLVTP